MEFKGLLYSQIGYDLNNPMRSLIRSTDKECVKTGAVFKIIDTNGNIEVLKQKVKYWGEIWKSHWWEIDFTALKSGGKYKIIVQQDESVLFESDEFIIGENVLWEKTIKTVAIEQFEKRSELSRNQRGWQDSGAEWREANSHATTIIGLCDLLNIGCRWLSRDETTRIEAQLIQGCDYLGLCQDKGEAVGYPKGAIVHEIPNHMILIPGDTAQSVVAFARASKLLTDINMQKSGEYLKRAIDAFEFLLHRAQPYGKQGFSYSNHGAPNDFNVPTEWMTRDLIMMMWGGLELYSSGQLHYKKEVISIANKVMGRQVTRDKSEGGYYGHFYTFDSCSFTEKANCHHHLGHDTGSTFPHYILPFIEMCGRWYDDPEVLRWKQVINDFAYGYFLPACSTNPFYLLPEGYFTGEGIITFCGPWHGINTSIAFAASLAAKLEGFTGDQSFRKISVGNIQWIAGLNAGLTSESFKSCVFWREEIEPGKAVPFSQIHGIGNRSVGCWTGIKGTIVNGFSANPQFQLVVPPTKENDGPLEYTDEDWIPHSAGWVSALTLLREVKLYSMYINDNKEQA